MIGFGVYYFSLSRDIKRGISELYFTFRFPKDRGSVLFNVEVDIRLIKKRPTIS